jgi:hypothetical protein
MKAIRLHGHTHNGRAVHITLRFDDSGNLLNPKSAAKNGMVGWGQWQESSKVPCGLGDCWWVSTAGHGGYILVTSKPLDREPILAPALKVEDALGHVYVYEFEEDCNWAILEYQDETLRRHALGLYNARRTDAGKDAITEAEYMDTMVLPCLRRWNPAVCSK